VGLGEDHCDALWPPTEGRGDLEGLLIAEIEFPDEDRSHSFQPPAWLGREITGDDRFSGRSLALNGAPGV
jgi:CYTH domain-containing protein